MDKISLLNHSVGVLCDNVRQNATKVILSSSPQNEKEKTASSLLERCFLFPVLQSPAAGGARCRSASDEISERTSAEAVSFMACARSGSGGKPCVLCLPLLLSAVS